MRGVRPWPVEDEVANGWVVDHVVGGYVCYTRVMTDRGWPSEA